MIAKFFSILILMSMTATTMAAGHHAKHNMVLLGKDEIFASHIVYKQPHNFQVILALTLDPVNLEKYQTAKAQHPTERFVFLLDHMDIKEIANVNSISGPVFYIDKIDQKHEVISSLSITRDNFKIVYFDELPLSLAADHVHHVIKCDDRDVGQVPGC